MDEPIDAIAEDILGRALTAFRKLEKIDPKRAIEDYDFAFFSGFAASVPQHGLQEVASGIHRVHGKLRDTLPEPPAILEPFLNEGNSHWEWLELRLNDRGLWAAIIIDQKIDPKAFGLWSQLSMEDLSVSIAEIYIKTAREQIKLGNRAAPAGIIPLETARDLSKAREWLNKNVNLPPSDWSTKPSLVEKLMATRLYFAKSISFTLPEWEAVELLDAYWQGVVESFRD